MDLKNMQDETRDKLLKVIVSHSTDASPNVRDISKEMILFVSTSAFS